MYIILTHCTCTKPFSTSTYTYIQVLAVYAHIRRTWNVWLYIYTYIFRLLYYINHWLNSGRRGRWGLDLKDRICGNVRSCSGYILIETATGMLGSRVRKWLLGPLVSKSTLTHISMEVVEGSVEEFHCQVVLCPVFRSSVGVWGANINTMVETWPLTVGFICDPVRCILAPVFFLATTFRSWNLLVVVCGQVAVFVEEEFSCDRSEASKRINSSRH